jgi:hypothetical protein
MGFEPTTLILGRFCATVAPHPHASILAHKFRLAGFPFACRAVYPKIFRFAGVISSDNQSVRLLVDAAGIEFDRAVDQPCRLALHPEKMAAFVFDNKIIAQSMSKWQQHGPSGSECHGEDHGLTGVSNC